MSNDLNETVKVELLDREFRISCPTAECESLRHAASKLDKKMREVRNNGKVIGMERIAIMAALNLAHDMLEEQCKSEKNIDQLQKEIFELEYKLVTLLHSGQVQLHND